MDYQLENLNDERFQEFCQALLAREFPKLQCFPVGQRDGGRDAIAYYMEGRNDEFIVFQVKYVRRPQAEKEPHKWLLKVMEEEQVKIEALIPRGAKEYYLLTNVPGTAYSVSGSIDQAHVLLQKMTKLPSQCWWRGDIVARLDNAWDLKWAYPELMTGHDILRSLVEAGLSEDKERRTNAIRAFVRDQYTWEETVRFKQVELQNRLLDLFIDVPTVARDLTRDRKTRTSGFYVITRLAQQLSFESGVPDQAVSDSTTDQILARRHLRLEEGSLGAASMLLHESVQKHVPFIVLEGAPGQGKSTITQYVCQIHRMRILNEQGSLAEVEQAHKTGPLRLPIRVDLRDLATWFAKQDPFDAGAVETVPEHWQKSLEAFLAALIRHHSGGIDFSVNDLHAVAKTSSILLVLDGLDEVADIQRRKEVVDEVLKGVRRIAQTTPSLQVVVTSRPAAFANSPGMPETEFQYCELGSLTKQLINAYAGRWLKARKMQGREAGEVNRILKEKMDQPHLRDLARNPMQLAILLSLIHTRGASLPDKRTALYDSYVELFFSREAEKSPIVREHRELLVEIHRYLAWVLHSESEQGKSRGSLKADELKRHVTEYLTREEYDASLTEQLFKGMIERVVALVSRVEGTYEFEVQPLREYFAARFLYETANYSPTGGEQGGTLPDRLDGIARNFFWLNVTRFYCGCFSKGELPSLVDRLEELVRAPGYRMISHPRVLAATLLSDWVFSQHPKSMRKVAALILDSLGLRRFVTVGGQQRSPGTSLVLPKQCGNEELVEQCFSILRGNPPRDFALAIMDLVEANTTVEERRAHWRKAVQSVTGDERTVWIEYGLHMQVLVELPDEEFDALMLEEDLSRKRLDVVFKIPKLARWEQDETCFRAIADAILDGDINPSGQTRTRNLILSLLAHAHSVWRYVVALRNRHPIPLSRAWEDLPHLNVPSLGQKGSTPTPSHSAASRCREFVDTVREAAESSLEEWASDMRLWDLIVEKSRSLFGDRWAQCRLACVSSGIKSVTEKCNDTPNLFDASKPMCRRARYARLRAGQPAWWEKQLQQAKTELDMSFGLLILLTWGSSNCLASLTGVIGPALEGLPSPVWLKLWKALGGQIDIFRSEAGENAASVVLISLPAHPSERMIAAFGERSDVTVESSLYKRFLGNYSGSDFAVLQFAQKQAIRHLLMPKEDRSPHLAMIERSYARGVMPAYGLARVAQEDPMVGGIPADVAEQIASYPDRYPMEIVGFAELFCKDVVSANIVPVGAIAARDRWFAT